MELLSIQRVKKPPFSLKEKNILLGYRERGIHSSPGGKKQFRKKSANSAALVRSEKRVAGSGSGRERKSFCDRAHERG